MMMARGQSVAAAQRDIGQVVEGYHAARAVREVAQRLKVTMPIADGIYGVLYEGLPVVQVVQRLMEQPVRPEFD
jgi:glycerol-3-phosphate dehydrogenase (NAD(P)+)